MTSDELVAWIFKRTSPTEWKNDDVQTKLKDIVTTSDKGRTKAAQNAIDNGIAELFMDKYGDKWIKDNNEIYRQKLIGKLEDAKSSQSLRLRYSRLERDREYKSDSDIDDFFNDKLSQFDLELERQKKTARSGIKDKSRDFSSIDNLRDLERLQDELFDLSQKADLESEVRNLYGRDFDRRVSELLEEERRKEE